MDEPNKSASDTKPAQAPRDRDRAHDGPRKRRDYTAGADGEQDVNAGPTTADDTFRPDRDGSGR